MLSNTWSDKRERQYDQIRDNELDRGRSKEKAEEIAARTVNKQRREAGETRNKKTTGVGNPNTSLENRSKQELYNRAKELDIRGRSKLSKSQLVDAIRDRS